MCRIYTLEKYIMWNAWLDESQAGMKTARRNINNLRYVDDITLMAESEEEIRTSWWGWKRRVKSWLKTQKTKITASGPITSWQIDGETMETRTDFVFLGSKITADGDCSHEIKTFAPWKRSYDKPRQRIKKERYHFADKCAYSQSYGFSSRYVWMWKLGNKEHWALKNWCFLTVVLEKTLENPLDTKELKPVNPKGNQPWTFIGRTDAEAPILWSTDEKSQFIVKDVDAEKDCGQEEMRMTGDEMAPPIQWTWVWANSRRSWRTGKPVCCSPWGPCQTQLSVWTTTRLLMD